MLKEYLKKQPFLYRQVQLYKRRKRLQEEQPQWQSIINTHQYQWQQALSSAQTGDKILVATSVGGDIHMTTVESLLATALTLRGAQVHILICDGVLPACFWCDARFYPGDTPFIHYGPRKDLCQQCYPFAVKVFTPLGLPIHRYSDFLTPEDYKDTQDIADTISVEDISNYIYQEIPVGEHALAGALRFYARASLAGEPHGEIVLRRYFQAALLTAIATTKLMTSISFKCAVFNHGIYVPQGITGAVARQQGVRVVNWNPAYRKQCFIFTHHDTYHHQLMEEPVSNWENMSWNEEKERSILDYLKSRWQGTQDWIWFHESPQFELDAIGKEVGVNFSLPCIGLLTNVMWDAQLHYKANAFPNMLSWIVETIEYFRGRPDLQLLIRVHPAEIRGTLRSRQPIVQELAKAIPQLPPNVFIIPPESSVSTYAAMAQCNAVLIYGTKMGVELTSMGIPVIVAGEAWIRNKNITLDASSVEEYRSYLQQLPFVHRLNSITTTRARKYAYHFFFRRMIPLEFTVPAKNLSEYQLGNFSLLDLLPGKSKGLDTICDGILEGKEFIV